MSECAAAGMLPDAFDHATYRQVFAFMRGAAKRRKGEQSLALATAWHTEAFARQKRLTPLNDILKKLDNAEPKPMTLKEQRMAMMNIAQAMGARVVHKRKET